MELLTIRSTINRICGMLIILGIPCLVIGIILIIKNKNKRSKIRGIILSCLIPASIIIRFISSLLFWKLGTTNYEDKNYQGIQPIKQNIDGNKQNGGRISPSETNY